MNRYISPLIARTPARLLHLLLVLLTLILFVLGAGAPTAGGGMGI